MRKYRSIIIVYCLLFIVKFVKLIILAENRNTDDTDITDFHGLNFQIFKFLILIVLAENRNTDDTDITDFHGLNFQIFIFLILIVLAENRNTDDTDLIFKLSHFRIITFSNSKFQIPNS